MASPFYLAPTLEEVVRHAVKFHAWKLRRGEGSIEHEGLVSKPQYLEKPGEQVVVLQPNEMGEVLAPGQLEHYSRRLGIALDECQKIGLKSAVKAPMSPNDK